MLHQLDISTVKHSNLKISFRIFGKEPGNAPVILVNHALTGNSTITGKNGWWKEVIAENNAITPLEFTIIAFDVPGNGQNDFFIENYKDYSTRDIAEIYWEALSTLNIHHLFAVIGGSLGGAIAWEMAFLKPKSIEKIVPIACHYKASDWLIGNVHLQESILTNSKNALEDARMHAMLLYRTPQSFHEKFQRRKNSETTQYESEEWMMFHGNALAKRYQLRSYRLMNHLLKTIGEHITDEIFSQFLNETETEIHLIAINTDYMFTEKEQHETFEVLKKNNVKATFEVIDSIHGHDAFLIEYSQIQQLIQPYFKIT